MDYVGLIFSKNVLLISYGHSVKILANPLSHYSVPSHCREMFFLTEVT